MTSGARSLALLVAGLPQYKPQSWDLQALMQSLAQVPSSNARFVETRHIALLTQPLELKGSLSYERPNRLAKHVQSPFDELLSVDGDALTVCNKTKGEQRIVSLREQPAAGRAGGERARHARRRSRRSSSAITRSSFRARATRGRLRLVPRDARVSAYVDTITLAGSGARLERIESVEASGDRSRMTILHDGK